MGRTTCCLIIPIHPASIVISVFGVIAGSVFGVGYAINIYNGNVFSSGIDKAMIAIPYVGMVSWMALAIISFFGLVVCWKQRANLVAIYFWSLLAHYIVDFGLFVANILAAHNSARQAHDTCQKSIQEYGLTGDTESLCKPVSINAVIFLSVLGVSKLIATYTTFVIFKYKRYSVRQAEEKAVKEAMKQQHGINSQQFESGELRSWSKFED
jgi:uncharacterized membrane protein